MYRSVSQHPSPIVYTCGIISSSDNEGWEGKGRGRDNCGNDVLLCKLSYSTMRLLTDVRISEHVRCHTTQRPAMPCHVTINKPTTAAAACTDGHGHTLHPELQVANTNTITDRGLSPILPFSNSEATLQPSLLCCSITAHFQNFKLFITIEIVQ